MMVALALTKRGIKSKLQGVRQSATHLPKALDTYEKILNSVEKEQDKNIKKWTSVFWRKIRNHARHKLNKVKRHHRQVREDGPAEVRRRDVGDGNIDGAEVPRRQSEEDEMVLTQVPPGKAAKTGVLVGNHVSHLQKLCEGSNGSFHDLESWEAVQAVLAAYGR